MTTAPKPILMLTALLGLAAVVTGVASAIAAIRGEAWVALGFEPLIIIAGLMAIPPIWGRFRASHVMTMCCVAGTVLVGGVLGFIAAGGAEGAASPGRLVRAMADDPMVLTRIGVAAALFGLAGLTMTLRRPARSMRYLGLGVVLAAPMAVAVGLLASSGTRTWLANLPSIGLAILAFVAFLVFTGFISASVHCFIRAFEVGRGDLLEEERDAATAT